MIKQTELGNSCDLDQCLGLGPVIKSLSISPVIGILRKRKRKKEEEAFSFSLLVKVSERVKIGLFLFMRQHCLP